MWSNLESTSSLGSADRPAICCKLQLKKMLAMMMMLLFLIIVTVITIDIIVIMIVILTMMSSSAWTVMWCTGELEGSKLGTLGPYLSPL